MIGSYAVYIGALVICGLCASIANRYNRKSDLWIIIALMTLLAGLRASSVGMDTANYLRLFGRIQNGQFSMAYGLEESFKYIIYGILYVVPDRQFALLLLALITNWCIITRFWEFRKLSSFPCMVMCYYMTFYFMSFNAIRQFVAIGIVFYCTRYLLKKENHRFILGILIAMLFHQSALIGFGILVMNCIRWRAFSKNQKILYLVIALATPVFLVFAIRLFSQYARYFSKISWDIGLMVLIKFAFFILTQCFIIGKRKYSYFQNDQNLSVDDINDIRIVSMCYFFALLLAVFGYMYDNAERISLYYYIFEAIYYGMLVKGKKATNRLIFGCFIALVVGYVFLYSMIHNSQGTMPYLFCW